MNEHPILFSGPLVRAILAGQKTVTRRLVRWPLLGPSDGRKRRVYTPDDLTDINAIAGKFCPYGARRDRLWVRETWQAMEIDGVKVCAFRASCPGDAFNFAGPAGVRLVDVKRWRPSIFMPRDFSRITLEVEDVRVERLHDLTEEDAVAEGIRPWRLGGDRVRFAELREGGDPAVPWDEMSDTARARFELLWQKINGKRAPWASNPWVWRVAFKRTR